MYAHYFTVSGRKFLIISTSTAPIGERIAVANKAEARRIATGRGALPWNF